MLPVKRPRLDMGDESEYLTALRQQLQIVQAEVEPVEVKRSHHHRSEAVTYRPTYRAVLAQRGYLVRRTLGSGSYSKVKLAYCFPKEHSQVSKVCLRSNKMSQKLP